MSFGDKLKSVRVEMSLSQSELATKLDMSEPAVRKWETGRGFPQPKTLRKISEVTGRPLEWFSDDRADSSSPERIDTAEVHHSSEKPTVRPTEASPVTEAILLQLLVKHQELLAEQQASVSRLTEVLSGQQTMLARQQEIFLASQQWQQRQADSQAAKQQALMDALVKKVESLEARLHLQTHQASRGRQQLLDPPAAPGLAGDG